MSSLKPPTFLAALVLGCLLLVHGSAPPSSAEPTTASGLGDGPLRENLVAILEEGLLDGLVLPAGLKSLEGLPLDQLCHLGLAYTDIDDLPLGSRSKLRSLDLYGTPLQRLPQLPDSIQWLDLRASTLVRDPEPYPEGLQYLGTDAYRITEQTRFPANIRALALNFREAKDAPLDFELMNRIRRKLPEGLEALALESIDDVEHLNGLPRGLRELQINNMSIDTLDGLPESLDRLFLKGNRKPSLDGLPPYLTELHFMETGSVQRQGALRFLEVLSISAEITVLKESTELPRLRGSELPIGFRQEPSEHADQISELPLLDALRLQISLDERGPSDKDSEPDPPKQAEVHQRIHLSSMPLNWLTSLSLQGATVELDLTNLPRLQSLTLKDVDPSEIQATDKDVWDQLKELDITLAEDASLSHLPPNLRKLVLRDAAEKTLEEVVGRSMSDGKSFGFPRGLVHLEIHGGGETSYMPLPPHVNLPSTLEHLVLHKVDADAWAEPISGLERLETVILEDIDVDDLDWLPKSVRHLGFAQTESKDRGFEPQIGRVGCPVH